MLSTIDNPVQTLGQKRVNPYVYLRPTAHPTSRSAARRSSVQAIE
jgi:hypothetical protein